MASKKKNETKEVKEEADIQKEPEEKTESEKTESKEDALEKELAASKEAHMRTLAEYDNYRKRTAKEKEAAYGDSKASCLCELLPILDNFDRALLTTDSDFDSFKKGMEMINTSFVETLKKLGVEAFGEAGEQFDPNIHNAVMHIEDEELDDNVITDVFSKGYKLGDRILRPAMVKVAN